MCKADLVAGRVRYPHPVAGTVLSEQEQAEGACLTCRAVPDSDVTIELRQDRLALTNPYRLALRQPDASAPDPRG